jgi:WD40 repeat protein
MKNIKNFLKNCELLRLIALIALFFAVDAFSMKRRREGEMPVYQTGQSHEGKGQYGFYSSQDDPDKIVWVDMQFVLRNSVTLKNMLEDFGGTTNRIPLSFSFRTIVLAFGVLDGSINTSDLSLEQLCDVAMNFNFLDVPAHKMNDLLWAIKVYIKDNNINVINNKLIQQLDIDIQRLLMIDPIISCLKNSIIKQKTMQRIDDILKIKHISSAAVSPDGSHIAIGRDTNANNLVLLNARDMHKVVVTITRLNRHPRSVYSIAFSPDGKSIVSGSGGNHNNLILWDISDKKNIKSIVLIGHPDGINSVAFSPDGKNIISCCTGHQNNLILWDIHDVNNIKQAILSAGQDNVVSVAFSPDGKQIAVGCKGNQNNFFLWDISDRKKMKYSVWSNPLETINAIAFSLDGKYMLLGCGSSHNSLALCDMRDIKNIMFKKLTGHKESVLSVAFSPDGKQIVSGGMGNQDNLITWNISDLNNITHEFLVGHPDSVCSVSFSSGGKTVISACYGEKNNFIEWTLLTDQEALLLQGIKKYSIDHIKLMYQICLQSLQGRQILVDHEMFMTLPADMRQLLNDLFMFNFEVALPF